MASPSPRGHPEIPGPLLSRGQLIAAGVLGGAAAAGVGYATALNAAAYPPHAAVIVRVGIIIALLLGGLFAAGVRFQRRMSALLLLAAAFSCVWLLNGSNEGVSFSLGVAVSALAPGVFCYLILAYPSGHIGLPRERAFLFVGTGVMAACWWLAVLSRHQPLTATPLLRCAPHCAKNVLSIGLPDIGRVSGPVLWVAWLTMVLGTAVLLVRRALRADASLRRLMWPMLVVATANAVLLLGFAISQALGSAWAGPFGIADVATTIAIPVAIFAGFAMERLFMGNALVTLIKTFGDGTVTDVETAMARAMHDSTLRIFYRRRGLDGYVDPSGVPVGCPPESPGRMLTAIPDEQNPLAIVSFDAQLSDHEPFIRAAGDSALMWLEKERLAADLTASVRDLEISRRRVTQAADNERRRIQRDLHDSAQQRLVGMSVRVGMARDTLHTDPARCAALLEELDDDMGAAMDELRSVASGVYPPTLEQYGLAEALRSALRMVQVPVQFEASGVGRHQLEIESAVYFACLEALQNISKHAAAGVRADLHLWEDDGVLHFQLRDSGGGFDPRALRAGSGLHNMRDRLAAVGGELTVESQVGGETLITGSVSSDGIARGGLVSSSVSGGAQRETRSIRPRFTHRDGASLRWH